MDRVRIGRDLVGLGGRIGKGGEGEVFALDGRAGQAVKIYDAALRQSREAKVRAMVGGSLAAGTDLVAFPAEIATDPKGGFIGFVMRLVVGYRPIHELYSPKSRLQHFPKEDYRFLIRAATNVARAVGRVHRTGCIIGDFNHSGVLVSNDATVALIDADSFQFTSGGRTFGCVVGVPDFTPPELHGRNLATVERTRDHDAFGLAVAVFHLLMMGRHPYAGIHEGTVDLSLGESIAQHRFAFSRVRQTQTRPPPGTPTLADLPPAIASAFEAAFAIRPTDRPDAAAWVALLGELEKSLNRCSKVRTHFYPSAAGGCIWCRTAAASGIDMFPEPFASAAPRPDGSPFDVGRVAATLAALTLPPPEALLPTWVGAIDGPSTALLKARQGLAAPRILGVVVLAAAVGGALALPVLFLAWLGLGIFGLVRLFGAKVDPAPFREAYRAAAEDAVREAQGWLQRSSATEIYAVRRDVEVAIAEYRQLDLKLVADMTKLKSGREARQRGEYLDRFRLRGAKIPSVSPARIAVLASFGIETAADLQRHRILAVAGFGEKRTSDLLAWRARHESGFRYDPRPNPSDVQAERSVRSRHDVDRAGLVGRMRTGLATLEAGRARLLAKSSVMDGPLLKALEARARAAEDLKGLGVSLPASPALPTVGSPKASAGIGRSQPSRKTVVGSASAAQSASGSPPCPQCGGTMIRRTARRGRGAGRKFWGCARYPACRGTRS